MAAIAPKQVVNSLKSVVSSVYKEGVDQILSWPQIDERGYMKFRFRGGAQVYDCEISPDGVISYIEAQRSDSILLGAYFGPIAEYIEDSEYANGLLEAEILRLDGKKCRIGKSCGDTCITMNAKCSQMLGLQQKRAVESIRKAVSDRNKNKNNMGFVATIAGGMLASALVGGGIALALSSAHKNRENAVDEAKISAEKEVEKARNESEQKIKSITEELEAKNKQDLDEVNSKLQEAESKVKTKEQEIEQNNKSINELDTKLASSKATIKTLQSKVKKLGRENKNSKSLLAEQSESLDKASQTIRSQQSELDDISSKLKDVTKSEAEKDAALKKASNAISQQQKEMDRVMLDLQSRDKTISEQSATIEASAKSASEYKKQLEQTQKLLNQKDKSIAEKEASIKALSESAKQHEAKLASASLALSEAGKSSDRANEEIAKLSKQVSDLERQKENALSRNQNTKAELALAQKEREGFVSEIERLQGSFEERVSNVKRAIQEEFEAKLSEADRKYSEQAKQKIEAIQKDVETKLQSASDPKPSRGFQPQRGDLISNNDGIQLGATHRQGSTFLNRPPESQITYLRDKAQNVVEEVYEKNLRELQTQFGARIKDIDKNVPSGVSQFDPSKLETSPKTNKGIENLENAVESATRKVSDVEKLYKSQLNNKNKAGEQLAKLGYLEQTIAQQRLREKFLEKVKNDIRKESADQHEALIDSLIKQASTSGVYDPSKVSPEMLKTFDEKARKIHSEVEKKMLAALNRSLSPYFAETLLSNAKNQLDNRRNNL